MRFYGIIILIVLFSCSGEKKTDYLSFDGVVQGTTYKVTYQSPKNKNYKSEIEQLLSEFDSSLSLYQPNSIISRVNKNDTSVIIDELFSTVFEKAAVINKATEGAFDITVGPIVNAWGFGPEESMRIDKSIIDSLLEFVGMYKVRIENKKIIKEHPGIKLDFNAIAQGYSADLICELFEDTGIKNYLVEIGGEVKTKGLNKNGVPWRIGIDRPVESNITVRELQAIVQLSNKAIATSGNYRKFYEENGIKYSHTINPKTGYPERTNLLSATVLTDECIVADAYATAFMVMGLEKSFDFVEKEPELEALFIYADENGEFQVKATKGFEKLLLE